MATGLTVLSGSALAGASAAGVLKAILRLEHIYRVTGCVVDAEAPISFGRVIGAGYKSRLPPRLKALVMRHYFEFTPFVDLAEEWGLTKGRISQLHRAALEALKIELRRR